MSDELDNLNAWSAGNRLRRADNALRDFSPAAWNDGAGSDSPLDQTTLVHAGVNILDEWQLIENTGFYQDADDRTLRLLPFVVYPGIIVAPWVRSGPVPPASKALWLVMEYQLGSVTYPAVTSNGQATTGWNGSILSASARLEWGEDDTRENQTFPSTYNDSMPPNNTFIWNARLGATDARGLFKRISGDGEIRYTCGQLMPPF